MIPKINSSHGSETRNIINRVIEVLNQQGKTIQDLVGEGQLSEEQYGNLINTVNGMLKSGEVGEYDLTPELRAEVNKVKDKIDAGDVTKMDITGELKTLIDTIPNKINHGNVSVEDIDKNKGKLDQTYLSSSLLEQIAGTAPINAVPANNSIGSEKLIDNSVTKHKKTIGGETATILSWNKIPDIDLVNRKMIFYPYTAIIHSKGRSVVSTETSVDFSVGSTLSILYDTSTSAFRSTNTSNSNTLGETEVFVVSLSFTTTDQSELLSVVGNIEYTVNGKNRIIKDSVHRDEIEDGAISISKTDFIEVNNFYNKNDVVHGVTIDQNTGLETEDVQYNTSKFIPMTENTDIYLKNITRVTYYDDQKKIITSYNLTPFTGGSRTTPPNASFIRLAVHNNYVEDAMVYLGTEDRAYEPFGFKILGSDINSGTDSISTPNTPKFPPENFDANFVAKDITYTTMTLQEINDGFDELITKYPNYISKKIHGKDATGEYDVIEYRLKPEEFDYNDNGEFAGKLPKVIYNSNVHGFEKTTALSSYYMTKLLCEDWRSSPELDFLRHNVEIVFIAISNPYGYVHGTYKNGRNINIQASFPINWRLNDEESHVYGGEEPMTEPEAQYISTMIEENNDALFFIDTHTSGSLSATTEDNLIYYVSPSQRDYYSPIIEESMKYSVEKNSRQINKYYQEDYEGLIGIYFNRPGNGTIEPYAASLGVPSYMLELFYNLPGDETAYQPTAIKACTEVFTNSILATLKTFKKRM